MSDNNNNRASKECSTFFPEPEPWPDRVDRHSLLDEIVHWIGDYVLLPVGAARAVALWSVATWFADDVDFAPILALLSPTKRAGKSYLLDLLRRIVHRPFLTSGVGITSAVLFRLNSGCHPTMLIDEAEKLSSQRKGSEIISLLNSGHRRGATVARCAKKNGNWDTVKIFDAFGFRALALIGDPWGTLVDRSAVVRMQRKPPDLKLKRFNGQILNEEGNEMARKICRWTKDNREAFKTALQCAPRPQRLNDRECDNWSSLFAVAEVAGGPWPTRAMEAAQLLGTPLGEDGDLGEKLISDIQRIFEREHSPEVINSTKLASWLNGIETSPWAEGGRDGITAHKLARLLKPFEVQPRQDRDRSGHKTRGYWLTDLQPVFERYVPVAEVGQVGQSSSDGKPSCPTSDARTGTQAAKWDGQNPQQKRSVPLVPVRGPISGDDSPAHRQGNDHPA